MPRRRPLQDAAEREEKDGRFQKSNLLIRPFLPSDALMRLRNLEALKAPVALELLGARGFRARPRRPRAPKAAGALILQDPPPPPFPPETKVLSVPEPPLHFIKSR